MSYHSLLRDFALSHTQLLSVKAFFDSNMNLRPLKKDKPKWIRALNSVVQELHLEDNSYSLAEPTWQENNGVNLQQQQQQAQQQQAQQAQQQQAQQQAQQQNEQQLTNDNTNDNTNSNKKKIVYLNSCGQMTSSLLDPTNVVYIKNVNITRRLFDLRDTAIQEAKQFTRLSDAKYLALNFVFLMDPEKMEMLYKLLKQTIKSIVSLFKIERIKVESHLVLWCQEMLEAIKEANIVKWNEDDDEEEEGDNDEEEENEEEEEEQDTLNILLHDMNGRALRSRNKNEKKLVDLLHAFLLKFKSWQDKPITEDTFIIQNLVIFLDVFFNCDKKYTYAYTHGFMERANVTTTEAATSSPSSSAAATTATTVTTTSKRKSDSPTDNIKPDYLVKYNEIPDHNFDVYAIEVKNLDAKVTQVISDKSKIGNQLKTMIDNLIAFGVSSPVVCGLVVEGNKCTIYKSFMLSEAVYPYVPIGHFNLMRDYTDLCSLPNIMEGMLLMKQIVDNTSKQIKYKYKNKQIAPPTPPSWRRPSFGPPVQINSKITPPAPPTTTTPANL